MKRQAKMDVLKEIRKIASRAMQDDMKDGGLKKVSVMSDSSEGLEAGLEKAKGMLEDPSKLMDAMHEAEESPEMEDMEESEESEDSPESIEAQIKALEEKKAKLMKK